MGSPSSPAEPHTPSSSLPQTGGLSENQKQNGPARIRGKKKRFSFTLGAKKERKAPRRLPRAGCGCCIRDTLLPRWKKWGWGHPLPLQADAPHSQLSLSSILGGGLSLPSPPPAAMTPSMHGLLECNLTPPTPPSWGERRHQHLQQHLAQAQRRGRKEGFHPLQTTSSPFPSQERVAGLQLSLTSHAGDRQGGKPSAQLLRTSKQNPAWFLETAQKRGR